MKNWNEMTADEQLLEAMKALKKVTSRKFNENPIEREINNRRRAKADFCNLKAQEIIFIEGEF